MSVKVFTLEEANLLVPTVDDSVRRFRALSAEIVRTQDAIAVLQMLGAEQAGSPERNDLVAKRAEVEELAQEFSDRLDEFNRHGCLLKDLETGLVDFYGLKDGRLIFLCWRIGESEIKYWHEISAGIAGRRSIKELQE